MITQIKKKQKIFTLISNKTKAHISSLDRTKILSLRKFVHTK